MKKWRERLIRELKGRPEGFCDGTKLICGMEQQLSPSMQELCDQRLAEGKRIAYYAPKNMKDASLIMI